MADGNPGSVPPGDNTGWPASLILGWGVLGSDPAGRRYRRRCAIALGALVMGTLGGSALNLRPVTAIAPGLAILYIASEFRRYLAAVDEFTRKLLLESVLWAYLFAAVAMMFAMGIILAYDLSVHPLLVICGLACVEGLRGTFLYFLARRHR
ncbi:MAG TPA: hypothetical protein VKX45_21100 [Bryobacteraceae bacterium]|jgi:hypothetical protein|nr:hypothetical protein [Bryobacteraceae bacterium]